MKTRIGRLVIVGCIGALWLCLHGRIVAESQDRQTAVAATEPTATLYVMNDSGKTVISGKQTVNDNGRKLASLPRRTFQRFTIATGTHVLRPSSAKKPEVRLEAEPGKTYYVVVAYRPGRSWGAPVAGSPMVLTQISEEEANELMRAMTEYMPH